MAQVVAPLMLDETGNEIAEALEYIYDIRTVDFPITSTAWAHYPDSDLPALRTAVDNGTTSLTDDLGWVAGDKRAVELTNGETITLVLATNTGNAIKLSDSTNPKFLFIMENCSKTTQAMNSSATNTGSWESSAMKTYLNGTFLNYFPSGLKSFIKNFKVVTAASYNGSSNQTSTQKLALFAAKEVFGGTASSAGLDTSYSNLTEFNALTQLDYFKNSANRIKQVNGSNSLWWLRSPYYNDAGLFCSVDSGGNAAYNGAHGTSGVLAFGCI